MSYPNIVSDVLAIDGICVTSRDWRLLRGVRLEFWKKLNVVHNVTPRHYKGLKFIENKKYCVDIVIGRFISASNDLVYHVLVAGNPSCSLKNLYGIIKTTFIKAVDQAFEKLDNGSESRKAANIIHCTYEQLTSNKEDCYNTECRSKPIRIFPDDTASFGQHFQTFMRRNLQSYNLEVCLLVCRLGQSESEHDAFSRLHELNLQYADQIILHVARDFTKSGKCLLWNFAKVEESYKKKLNMYGTAQKIYYSNVFVGGHGNVELNWTQLDSYKEYSTKIQLATVKYYANAFKEFHRGKEPTWRTPRIEESLTILSGFEKPNIQQVYELSRIKGRIVALREYCQSKSCAKSNIARCEAILSLSKSEEWTSTEKILRIFQIFYAKMFSAGIRKCLNEFPYQEFTAQIENTIILAADNLEPIVDTTLAKRNAGQTLLSIPRIDIVLKAVVCEMLISFGIYGKLNHKVSGPRFRARIINSLRLRPSSFAKKTVTFNGLAYCCNLKVDQYNNYKVIVYTGPVSLHYQAWQNIRNDVSEQESNDLHQLLEEIHNHRRKCVTKELIDLCTKKLPAIIWSAVVCFSGRHCFRDESFLQKTPQDIIRRACNVDVLFYTCLEFTNHLFFGEHQLYQIGLARLAREILFQTDRIVAKEISLAIAKFFEGKLLQIRGLCLLYPLDKACKRCILILPLQGQKGQFKDTFIESPLLLYYGSVAERQYWILRLYQFAMQKTRQESPVKLTGIGYLMIQLANIARESDFDRNYTFMDIFTATEKHLCKQGICIA